MSFINMSEVKSKIAFHEAQLRALRSLQQIGDILEKSGGGRRAPAAKAVSGAKRGPKAKRGKRGMLSGSIVALLENSRSPLQAGDIKRALVEQGVIDKKSTSVYAMLLQMGKRGVIKKVKTPEGMTYNAVAGGGEIKLKRRGRKPGRKKKTVVEQSA
jgi:hypothetical protein